MEIAPSDAPFLLKHCRPILLHDFLKIFFRYISAIVNSLLSEYVTISVTTQIHYILWPLNPISFLLSLLFNKFFFPQVSSVCSELELSSDSSPGPSGAHPLFLCSIGLYDYNCGCQFFFLHLYHFTHVHRALHHFTLCTLVTRGCRM